MRPGELLTVCVEHSDLPGACVRRLISCMDPCHTRPFVRPGVVIDSTPSAPAEVAASPDASCDYCGAASLEWRKCKLICTSCRQINKSCADL